MRRKNPFTRSQKSYCWTVIRERDFINEIPICTLCGQEEIPGDNQNYKLTLGHLNIKQPHYRQFFNSNSVVNITPQHFICNQRLEGREFYAKYEQHLISIIEKNIHYNNSYLSYKHQKISELKKMDISELKNHKSDIYDNVIPRYLDCFLQSSTDWMDFDKTTEDIAAFIYEMKQFGSQKATATHLKKICNPHNLRYVIEENQDGNLIIRLITPEEHKAHSDLKLIFDSTLIHPKLDHDQDLT